MQHVKKTQKAEKERKRKQCSGMLLREKKCFNNNRDIILKF